MLFSREMTTSLAGGCICQQEAPLPFRIKFSSRILLFLCVMLAGIFVAGILQLAVMHIGGGGDGDGATGVSVAALRLSILIQDLFMMVLPAVVCAVMFTTLPARFLCIDSVPSLKVLLLAVGTLIASIPVMNAVVEWNQGITPPDSFLGIPLGAFAEWMRTAEDAASAATAALMGNGSAGSLVMSLLIVAVLAGVSEELFFRGLMQRMLATRPMNIHAAIWLTAVIFSLIHLQFFGFVPRMLLGAYFGYLLYWSRSLWVPVLCHVFNNAVVCVTLWRQGGREGESMVETVGTGQGGASVLWIIAGCLLTALLLRALRRATCQTPQSPQSPQTPASL